MYGLVLGLGRNVNGNRCWFVFFRRIEVLVECFCVGFSLRFSYSFFFDFWFNLERLVFVLRLRV